jgi:phosphohistidine phosphatase
MASVLGKVGIQPDRILTSPARRALKTARAIADILGCDRDRIVVDEAIYDTGYRALLGSIQAVEEGCDVLFVVGHNPEITELAEDFTSTEIRSVPTCGIFCCAFNIDSWSDICDGGGRLVFYDFPKNHPERKST